VVGLVVLLVVGLRLSSHWQKKWNEARAKDDDPGVLGGQVSHIADLYQALDATDPARFAPSGRGFDLEPGRPGSGGSRGSRSVAVSSSGAPEQNLPVVAPAWSLDAAGANVPNGRVNGTISGSNFVADSAWLFTGGGTQILALRQGPDESPDREVLLYLRLKPGEKLQGGSWGVSPDQKMGAPSVAKRWKAGARAAPQQKSFTSGYVLKLEFGQAADGELPGKLYLALPDAERTVVAGVFRATLVARTTATPQPRSSGAPGFSSEDY
jgi:hypothetical protein